MKLKVVCKKTHKVHFIGVKSNCIAFIKQHEKELGPLIIVPTDPPNARKSKPKRVSIFTRLKNGLGL